MKLRTLDDPITTPQPGSVTIAVARHVAPTYPSEEVSLYHADRAKVVHDWIGELAVEPIDLGETDGEPREIVEVVVPITAALIGAIGAILASRIGPPSRDAKAPKTVLGVSIKRPDGTQMKFTYRGDDPPETMDKRIERFLARLQ